MMTRKQYQMRWSEGARHRVPLVEEDRERLLPEVNGEGGANDIIRWLRRNTRNLFVPNQAVAIVTDGILERVRDISTWGDSRGGFQTKMPVQSLVRAGLIDGEAQPTQRGLL